MNRRRFVGAVLAVLALGAASLARAEEIPAPDAGGTAPTAPPSGLTRWFDPSTAPFIPVPLIGTDPNSGTTVGILPVWLKSNDEHQISRIIAPDVLHNPYFGWGADARLYAYESSDEQWSVDAGFNQRVERNVDALYQLGRLREQRWSMNFSFVYDRSGTPRFYGIGNGSLESNETNYTSNQELLQAQLGYNFSRIWQLLYTSRFRNIEVLPGTLSGIDSIEERFGRIQGLRTNNLFLNRLSLIYDTRDDLTVPSRGMELVAYGGAALGHGSVANPSYTEAGFDGRDFWPITRRLVLATHVAVHYLPYTDHVPFWALSALGGGESQIGGDQALRGFGAGRFAARNSFSSSIEVRSNVFSFDAVATRVDIEIAPFLDLGRVYSHSGTLPFDDLHHVFGVGFRGIARPFVVGKVDVGYGSEGVAVFTGLNYPF